jgi:hypothetical protein
VKDQVFFGSEDSLEESFDFTFGCVSKETNLFYTQEADGILGLTKEGGRTE